LAHSTFSERRLTIVHHAHPKPVWSPDSGPAVGASGRWGRDPGTV